MAAFFFSTWIFACYQPSPLYGKWQDNKDNYIMLSMDGSFSAQIVDSNRDKQSYEGTYKLQQNIISFTTKVEKATPSRTIITEWDIHGSVVTLKWTDTYGVQIPLILYRIL